MASPIDQLVKVQDQVLETVASLQQPVVEVVQRAAESAESFVPDLPAFDFLPTEKLPQINELVINQFQFAEKLLVNQKAFASALLESIKPVTDKVGAAEPVTKTTTSRTTTKAATAA